MLTLLALLLRPSELPAQTLSPQMIKRMDTNAAEVATLLRTKGHSGNAVTVLTQTLGPQPREKLDEIADTLMGFAMTFPGDDVVAIKTRDAAKLALIEAGMGHGGFISEGGYVAAGEPYAGAAERLMKIVESAEDPAMRASTLRSLADLPDRRRLLPFLRQIATSETYAAREAIIVLNELTGPAGIAMLTELYDRRLVTEPRACELLAAIAEVRRWPAPVVPLTVSPRRPGHHSIWTVGPC